MLCTVMKIAKIFKGRKKRIQKRLLTAGGEGGENDGNEKGRPPPSLVSLPSPILLNSHITEKLSVKQNTQSGEPARIKNGMGF